MNTAVMKRESLGEMKPERLEAQIAELTERLQELDECLSASRLRQATLASERQGLVLPARVNKDPKAQARLLGIDEDLTRILRDIALDTEAVSDLNKKLQAVQNALALAQREQHRAAVRGLLQARLDSNRAARIMKAAEQLRDLLQAAEREDAETYKALVEFDASFARSSKWIRRAHYLLGLSAGSVLTPVMEIDTRSVTPAQRERNAAEDDRRLHAEALRALEAMDPSGLVF